MDSIINKMLDSIRIKDRNSHSRRGDRYYDDGYELRSKKTSSTESSRSDDDDDDGDYDIKGSSSTVEKVEDFVNQMFQACAGNVQGIFNDPSSPRCSSGENRRRLKGGSGYNGATSSYESKSGFVSQRKRGTRSSSRRRRGVSRSVSRTRQRNQFPHDTPLPGNNKMTLYVNNDDDEVSALSAGTFEEMCTRQQRLILLQEANRKGAVARLHSYPPNNYTTNTLQINGEHLGCIHPDELQNNMEDTKSFYSVSSAKSTVFEGIWNKSPSAVATTTRERVGIYEERDSNLEECLDINCKSIPEGLELESTFKSSVQTESESECECECETPLSRKLKRHQVKSGMQFQAIEEDTNDAFSLRPDEEEI